MWSQSIAVFDPRIATKKIINMEHKCSNCKYHNGTIFRHPCVMKNYQSYYGYDCSCWEPMRIWQRFSHRIKDIISGISSNGRAR